LASYWPTTGPANLNAEKEEGHTKKNRMEPKRIPVNGIIWETKQGVDLATLKERGRKNLGTFAVLWIHMKI
jgi:hypothetical protein